MSHEASGKKSVKRLVTWWMACADAAPSISGRLNEYHMPIFLGNDDICELAGRLSSYGIKDAGLANDSQHLYSFWRPKG